MTTPEEFAEFYHVSLRQIHRWRAEYQKKLKRPAPLGDPQSMVDFWPEVFTNKVSSKLVDALDRVTPPVIHPPAVDAAEFAASNFNYNDSVAIAELNLRACATILERAIATGDPVEIRKAQPAYNDASETLRKTKLASARITKDDGDSFDAATVRAEIHRIHGSIPKSLRTKIKEDLVTFYRANVTPTLDQIRSLVDKSIDDACVNLTSTAFADPS